MTKTLISVWAASALVILLGCDAGASSKTNKVKLDSQKDKVSYSIGLDIGNNLKRQKMDLDMEKLVAGLKDVMEGRDPILNDSQVQEVMTAYQKEWMAQQDSIRTSATKENLASGEKFLEENKKKEGVKTLPSGLQYKVIEEGSGPSPTIEDQVVAHYTGTLLDGTEFDSSHKRGEPATFPVQGVIPGWTEALQLMKEGAKWKLFIPPNLAYGERGAGQAIGPNQTLIFDIELLEVKENQASAAPENKTPEVKTN